MSGVPHSREVLCSSLRRGGIFVTAEAGHAQSCVVCAHQGALPVELLTVSPSFLGSASAGCPCLLRSSAEVAHHDPASSAFTCSRPVSTEPISLAATCKCCHADAKLTYWYDRVVSGDRVGFIG